MYLGFSVISVLPTVGAWFRHSCPTIVVEAMNELKGLVS